MGNEGKVVTFGEMMLRLSPAGYYRFFQTPDWSATFGGGEANVAVSLANYGLETEFVSKVPNNEIGKAALSFLRSFNVGTKYIETGDGRMGIYFCEKGASQRASKVIYDRKDSVISQAMPEDFQWEEIFKDSCWFHFTGITPALSDSLAEITKDACKKAKKLGLIVSCDLNYRKKLWSREKARKVMTEIIRDVDICIANEEDAADVFGIHAPGCDVEQGKIEKEGYEAVAKQIARKFGCKAVAITLRSSFSSSDNGWGAMLYYNGISYFSKNYDVRIVDRVGGGDSFAGALIYAFLAYEDPQTMIDFAAAGSCLKHSIEGDFNRVSLEEVEQLLETGGNGRIRR